MQKPINFSIDTLLDNTHYISKNVMQGDTLVLTVNVSQNSASLNLTGQDIHIIVRMSNNLSVEMKTGNANLSTNGSVITAVFKDLYNITDSIGDATGEVILIDSNGESSTNHFIFTVKESLASNLIVKMEDEIDTLKEINELIDNYNSNADHLEQENNKALQNINDLGTINTDANNTADRLETDIATGIQVAERLETDIATGNTLDATLKQDIINGNITHNNLTLAITNGNEIITQLPGVNWPTILSFISLMEIALQGMRLTDENGNYFTDENGNYFTM